MKKWLLLLVLAASAAAQTMINPNTQIKWPQATGSGAPTATCASVNLGAPYVDVTNNIAYFCGTGGWQVISSGGGGGSVSGQAAGVVPLGTSSTVIGAQSHMNDGVTTPGTITSSEPFVAPSFNGVALSHTAGPGAFLNGNGAYATPSGNSVQIKYLSVEGCPQDSDPNAGGGTDATACINALLALATPTNPIIVVQDKGFSLISNTGIYGPSGGNWAIQGNGGGIATTQITNCSISGGVAILTTLPNTLTAGQKGTLAQLTHCPTITNTTVTVLSAGLSSTQFEVSAGGTVASGAETGTFRQVYGTGFYLQNSTSNDAISNGPFFNTVPASNNCAVANSGVGAPIPSQGAGIMLRDFVINGNSNGQSVYCFGAHIANINGVTIDNVVFYNSSHFSLLLDNASSVVIHGSKFFSSSTPLGTLTDGIHLDGFVHHVSISDNYFKTGDDAIAINAIEGYCGPISHIEIANNTFDNAFTAMRMYNMNLNTCSGNGFAPLISYINFTNNSGTVATHPFIFGLGVPPYQNGNLNPAMSHIHISNSSFNSPASSGNNAPFLLEDNIDDISISDFTLDSPNMGSIIQFGPNNNVNCTQPGGLGFFNRLSINNLTINMTAAGSAFTRLVHFSECTKGGTISVNGLGLTFNGIAPTLVGPIAPNPDSPTVTYDTLLMSNIDTTHMYLTPASGANYATWIPSKVPSVMIMANQGALMMAPIQTYGSADGGIQNGGFSGQLSLPNGGVAASTNCTFSSVIVPTVCVPVYYNNVVHYIPVK